MAEAQEGKEVQSVKGILKAEVKATKTGASYFQCRVGTILTNAFQGNVNYDKVELLNGKPVILEYTITPKGKDFVDIELDPNPPAEELGAPAPIAYPETMTKTDWEVKQRKEMREKLIGRAIQALQLSTSSISPEIINEWALVFETKYVYREELGTMAQVEEPEKVPKEQSTQQAEPELKLSPIDLNWLRTSMVDLQKKGLADWSNTNVVSFLKTKYHITADSVSGCVKELTKEQAREFVTEVQKALSIAGIEQ